jgi:hypothetical protein
LSVLLALLFALPSFARAADAAPPAPAVERVLLVPFDALHAVMEGDRQRVWMSRLAYEDLRRRAVQAEAEQPPYGAAAVDADYRVAVSNERAVVSGVVTLETFKPGLQAVDLAFSGLGLMSADIDGKPAPLVITNGAVRVLVEGPARRRLVFEGVAPVAMAAARQTLQLELPSPASARLRLTVAGDVEVQSGADVMSRRFDAAANRTDFDVLPRRGPMTLVMSLNSRLKSHDRAVVARSVIVDEVAPSLERLRAALTFDVQRRPIDELRVSLPREFEVTEAASPHVTAWSVEDDRGQRTLVLRLRKETTGRVTVQVAALRVHPDLSDWRLPVLQPLDVESHVAIVGVAADRTLEIGDVRATGLIPVDLGVIGEAMQLAARQVPAAETAGSRTVLAYYAPSAEFGLSATCRPVPPSLLLTANYVLTVSDAGLVVNGGLALLPRREKLFALDVLTPAGWRVTRAAMSGGGALPFEVFDATGGAARVQIRFPQGLPPERDAGVELVAESAPKGWSEGWTTREEPFPEFVVGGVTRERGAIAVNAVDDLAVRAGRLEGLYPLDENRKDAFGLGGVPTSLAYAYEAHPFTATMTVERRVPRVTAETYAFCRVMPDGLDLRYELIYAVADARVRDVQFSLPTNTPAAVAITGVGETAVKESAAAIEAGRRVWRVKLADARSGVVHIAAEMVMPAAFGPRAETQVPGVRAEGVEYQSGWVAVEGLAELEVTPVSHPRGVDVGEMVDAEYRPGRRLLGAYSFVGEPVAVALRVERRPGAFLPPAVVQRVEMATILSAEGRSQSAVRLMLRGGAQLVDVRLPEGSGMWAASIDGTPARPRKEGDRILMSLPPRPEAATVDVRVVYEDPVDTMSVWSRVRLSAPALFFYGDEFPGAVAVPMADMRWEVYLPEGYRAVASSGTLQALSIHPPEPAAGQLARWLYRMSGGMSMQRGLIGGCVRMAGCSAARARMASTVGKDDYANNVDTVEMPPAPGEQAAGDAGGIGSGNQSAEQLAARVDTSVPGVSAAVMPAAPAAGPTASFSPQSGEPPADKPQRQTKAWAIEGISSLDIELSRVGAPLGFHSLGSDPRLELRVVQVRRMSAAAWTLALAALLAGAALTPRPRATRWTFTGVVLAAAMAVPLIPGLEGLVLLCNPLFHAAVWLAVYYVAWAAWRGLAARRALKVSRRGAARTASALLLLAALGSTPSATLGAEAAPAAPPQGWDELIERRLPLEVPATALIMPYRTEEGPAAANQVLVPYADFTRMTSIVARAADTGSPTSPVPFAVESAVCRVTLTTGTYVVVSATLSVEVLTDAPVAVPLNLGGAVLVGATMDGGPAALASRPSMGAANASPQQAVAQNAPASLAIVDGGFLVCIKGRGRHVLELTIRAPVERRGGWRIVEATVPSAPTGRLALTVPEEGTEVHLRGGLDRMLWRTRAAGERIDTAVGPGGQLSLQWRSKTVEGNAASALTSSAEALLDLREDQVRLVWGATLAFRGGERSSFAATLPAGYLLEKVEGENVRGWALAEGQDRQQAARDGGAVTVELLRPSSAEAVLTFHLWRPVAGGERDESSLTAPMVRFPDAVREQGRLSVRRSPLLDVRTLEAGGMQRADWPDAAGALAALIPDSPLGSVPHEAYEFASPSAKLALRSRPVAARVSASVQAVYKLTSEAATLEARVEVVAEDRPVHALVLRLPGGMKIDEVAAPGLAEWTVRESAATNTVYLQFAGGVSGRLPVLVRSSAERKGERKGPEGADAALPWIVLDGAARQDGWLVVQAEAGFDVVTRELAGIEAVPLRDAFGWLSEPQRALARVALRYGAPAFSGRVGLVRRQPDVTSYTVTNVRATDRAIEETVLISLSVRNAGVRQIRFVLPDNLAAARIRVPYLREKRLEPDGAGGVTVTADLQDEIMGEIKVLVEHDRIFTGGRQTVRLPRVLTGRMSRQYVTLENSGRDELTVESREGLDPLEREQREWALVEPLMRGGMGQAFMAAAESAGASLVFSARQRQEVKTAGARIGLAQCTLVMDSAGAYRGEQVYQIDNQTEQFLDIELPPGAALWSAAVAGDPVKPIAGATGSVQRVRVPLVKTAPGDIDYVVSLKYGGVAGALPAMGAADAPLMRTLNVNVELSQVELRLPRSHRWLHFSGTMREVQDTADFEAGKLAYQNSLAKRLVRSLQYGGVFEKARAASNLKNVQKDLQRSQDSAKTFSYNTSLNLEVANAAGVVAEAQRQLDVSEQTVKTPVGDNRGWLNGQFARQRNELSRGDALKSEANWDEASLTGKPSKAAEQKFKVKSYWGDKERPEGDEKAGGKPDSAPELYKEVREKTKVTKSPVALKQNAVFFQQDAAAEHERDGRLEDSKKKGQVDLAARYQRRLEVEQEQQAGQSESPSTDDDGSDNGQAVDSFQEGEVLKSSPIVLRGIFASRSPGARGAALGLSVGGEAMPVATGLSSMQVDLPPYDPARWEIRRFVTPRGDAGVRAYGLRTTVEDRLTRLLALLAAAAVLWALVGMVRAGLRSEAVQRFAPPAMIFVGGVGLFVGVLPVAALVLLICGFILRRGMAADAGS